MDRLSNIFKFILPIYWAILTYMLLKPGVENKEYWFMFSGIDKVLHLSIFAFLGFCYRVAFQKSSFYTFIYIMLIYAFLTEILQEEMHLGRSMELLDIFADALGVLTGYYVFQKLRKYIH